MLAVLAALAAAAAARAQARAAAAPRGADDPPQRATPRATGRRPRRRAASPRTPRRPTARSARLALGARPLALALVAPGSRSRASSGPASGPAQGANPSRLVSAQSNRYEYWRVAVGEFGDAPLQGGGSGSFRTVWLRERPIDETVRDAHSLYFETAAELGIVGLLALLAFVAGIVAMARRSAEAAGAIGALAVFAIHAGLDWDWELPALTLVALTLAARLATADAPPDAS